MRAAVRTRVSMPSNTVAGADRWRAGFRRGESETSAIAGTRPRPVFTARPRSRLQDHRAIQTAWVVGVEAQVGGTQEAEPVHPEQVRHRVDVAVFQVRSRGGDVVGEVRLQWPEGPDRPAG